MLSTTDKTNRSIINDRLSENKLPNYTISSQDNNNFIELKNNSNQNKKDSLVQKSIENINDNEYNELEYEKNNIQKLNKFTTGNLILVYDENDHKFTFYNSNKSILGSFNFKQIIKYIGKQIDPLFYSNIESGYSEELIKSMLSEILIDPITGKINIILKSHLESPFMGNLDLLIRLNNLFYTYEIKELLLDISTIQNEKFQYNLKLSIKQFIYLLINHTLKIIAIASDELKDDKNNEAMKYKLLKYSVALTYRISNFMKEHLDNYNNQYKNLYNQLQKLVGIKNTINNKINDLEDKISKQNNLIYSIINKKTNLANNNIDNSSTHIITEKDFNKFFEKDANTMEANYYDSEFMIDNSGEKYLITEANENSDVSLII